MVNPKNGIQMEYAEIEKKTDRKRVRERERERKGVIEREKEEEREMSKNEK